VSKQAQAPQGGTAAAQAVSFRKKSFLQKCVHVGKAALCILSFGFAFPHIFSGGE
jgi:hypothetical protein